MIAKVTEHPIIFQGWGVRAILKGSKTQTRRVIRNLEKLDGLMLPGEAAEWCPYGQPGDLLWVKETWAPIWTEYEPSCDPADEQTIWNVPHRIEYRADSGAKYPGEWPDDAGDDPDCAKWGSSMFMPKCAARLWLRLTDVRVQRVQEISEEDSRAEGAHSVANTGPDAFNSHAYRDGFQELWDSINGKRPDCSWVANPWVWALTFERVIQP